MLHGEGGHDISKNSGLNIKWGALVVGAGIAIAAVVGFVFFPEASLGALDTIKVAINAAYNAVGDVGNWVQNLVGRGGEDTIKLTIQKGINSAYEGIRSAGMWFGENVVGGSDKGLVGFIMDNKLISIAAAAFGALGLDHISQSEALPAPNPEIQQSHAIKLQMDRANALMLTRLAVAGHPQAQAMLAQQRGRA